MTGPAAPRPLCRDTIEANFDLEEGSPHGKPHVCGLPPDHTDPTEHRCLRVGCIATWDGNGLTLETTPARYYEAQRREVMSG